LIAMLSVGIDVGAENTKVAVIEGDRLLAFSVVPSGWDTQASLQRAFNEAVEKAGVNSEAITRVGATGMGGKNVAFASVYATDSTCNARGVVWLFPGARTVIDIGAEQIQAMTLDDKGTILQCVRNDQCAAGVGAFITEMASVLELRTADLSQASLLSQNRLMINSTCTIFAESEVISLINEGFHKNDIARAVCDAITGKAASLVQELKIEKDIVFIGGVARNSSIRDLLAKKLGMDIIVPEEPCIITAIGAALTVRGKHK
jgi:predicted CoA-substrate-specific enzyme activase